jgi:hypothetical protein
MEAVLAGHGVALARTSFAAPDLDSGRLVRPFNQSVKAKFSQYVVYPIRSEGQDKITRFKEWILAEATRVHSRHERQTRKLRNAPDAADEANSWEQPEVDCANFFSTHLACLVLLITGSSSEAGIHDILAAGESRRGSLHLHFPKGREGIGEAALALASRGRHRNRGGSRQAPLPAALFARPQSDQNGLRQAEGRPSQGGCQINRGHVR